MAGPVPVACHQCSWAVAAAEMQGFEVATHLTTREFESTIMLKTLHFRCSDGHDHPTTHLSRHAYHGLPFRLALVQYQMAQEERFYFAWCVLARLNDVTRTSITMGITCLFKWEIWYLPA